MVGNANFKDRKNAKIDVRRNGTYGGTWAVDMIGACPHDPLYCLGCGVLCPWISSYLTRKRALYHDMQRYVCCNGDCPCSGRMGEQKCPEFCLCMEVFFCFTQSVASTRWMLQDEMHIANTKCDNCLIGTAFFCAYLSCICNIIACLTQIGELDLIADVVSEIAQIIWCSVCACMLTQHKAQLDLREKNPAVVRPPANPYVAPPQQVMGQHFAPPQGSYSQQQQVPQGGMPPPGFNYPQHPPQQYQEMAAPQYQGQQYQPQANYTQGAYHQQQQQQQHPAPGAYQQPPPGYPQSQYR
mmetsp:Transcript_19814/g.59851  ORF Transcript_19814/g.59851 Transcript_19814/m.59851 type:complete len:297 (-) Transcript_19814:591-1481(-)